MAVPYKQEYADDEKILGNKKFSTCLFLTKDTFKKIDDIKAATSSNGRSNVITAAIDYYFDMLKNGNGEYQKYISERLNNG